MMGVSVHSDPVSLVTTQKQRVSYDLAFNFIYLFLK